MVTSEALKPAPQPRRVTILGSTGSVGRSTLDLHLARDPDAFAVEALTAQRQCRPPGRAGAARCARASPRSPTGPITAPSRRRLAGTGIEVAAGPRGAGRGGRPPADWVMAAIVGAAGLEPTLAAVKRGAIVGARQQGDAWSAPASC